MEIYYSAFAHPCYGAHPPQLEDEWFFFWLTYDDYAFSQPSADSLQGYYAKSREINHSQGAQTNTATFLAVGDIMLSRNVAAAIQKSGNSDLPFSSMQGILQSTDFNFANLESPVGNVVGGHSLRFGAPKQSIPALAHAKFKVVNLANNHAFDEGLDGITATIRTLDSNDIRHEGTGQNLDQAWAPAVVQAHGLYICFIGASYASSNDGGKTKNNYVARIEDIENLKLKIENSKSLCDFVVATMHAGVEYTRTPNQAQIDFARAAIDAGADMVIGAHPHWVQTVEKYNGKYIFYSLGNFIFDQMWSQDTKEGLALKITLSKTGCSPDNAHLGACNERLQGPHQFAHVDSVELIPIIIENYSTPRPATPEETKKILQKIGETETILP